MKKLEPIQLKPWLLPILVICVAVPTHGALIATTACATPSPSMMGVIASE